MKIMKLGRLAGALAVLFAAGQTQALTSLDFESGFSGNETALTGSEFSASHDITFSTFDSGLRVVKTAQNQAVAFRPFNNPFDPQTMPLGDYFLAGDFNRGTSLTITLGFYAPSFSFDIVDIDYNETFKVSARDINNQVLETQTFVGSAANDRKLANVSFSAIGEISHIVVKGFASNGNSRNLGFGYDNFSWVVGRSKAVPPVVPLPGGLVLGMSAFGLLAVARARRSA